MIRTVVNWQLLYLEKWGHFTCGSTRLWRINMKCLHFCQWTHATWSKKPLRLQMSSFRKRHIIHNRQVFARQWNVCFSSSFFTITNMFFPFCNPSSMLSESNVDAKTLAFLMAHVSDVVKNDGLLTHCLPKRPCRLSKWCCFGTFVLQPSVQTFHIRTNLQLSRLFRSPSPKSQEVNEQSGTAHELSFRSQAAELKVLNSLTVDMMLWSQTSPFQRSGERREQGSTKRSAHAFFGLAFWYTQRKNLVRCQ